MSPFRLESHGNKVVAKLRDSHHRIAMLFAAGMRTAEVARETGYSLSYISNLRGDPAMCDLVAHYHQMGVGEHVSEISGMMLQGSRIIKMALGQMEEHLQEAQETGEKLRVRELLSTISTVGDRSGYSKHETHTVEHTFAARLDKALAASSKVIELRVEPLEAPADDPGDRQSPTVEALPASPPKVRRA